MTDFALYEPTFAVQSLRSNVIHLGTTHHDSIIGSASGAPLFLHVQIAVISAMAPTNWQNAPTAGVREKSLMVVSV